jgi:hypothetical protein
MGTLVFQATLGGAINLIGPNTASTVNFTLPSADGTSGQALSTNGSGTLAFGTLAVGAGGTGQTSYTNGQLLIGNTTGNTLTKATLTAGTNITITNGAGAITIAASGGGSAATSTALGTVYGVTPLGGTGGNAVALGYEAASTTPTASQGTAIGYQALKVNTGAANTAIGHKALASNTSATDLVAVGDAALFTNVTGANLVAVGAGALYSNTGSNNTAVGRAAMQSNTSGNDNVGVGYQALYTNTTSLNNVAVGYQALYSMTTTGVGNNNVGVGYKAGYANTAGSSVFIGYGAGQLSTAANNIFIGVNAGATNGINVTTGTNNVVIGNAVSLAAAGNTNSLVLGDNVNGKGSSTGFISSGGGGVYQGNNSSSWSTTSDFRLKKNIADNNDGLSKINSIRVRNFEYRLPEEVDAELKPTDAIKKTGVQLGVIAQELQAVLPECVKQESTGVLSVDTDNLTWYLINAIKELKAEFDAYKASHP